MGSRLKWHPSADRVCARRQATAAQCAKSRRTPGCSARTGRRSEAATASEDAPWAQCDGLKERCSEVKGTRALGGMGASRRRSERRAAEAGLHIQGPGIPEAFKRRDGTTFSFHSCTAGAKAFLSRFHIVMINYESRIGSGKSKLLFSIQIGGVSRARVLVRVSQRKPVCYLPQKCLLHTHVHTECSLFGVTG